MFGRAKKLLGLDIGTHSIKAVELTVSGTGLAVTRFGLVEIIDEGMQGEALRRLVVEQRLRGAGVVSAVSGRSVIVRNIVMRQMSDEELRRAIPFEADKYIPFGVEEVLLDCQPLPEAEAPPGEMRVVLVAVKRNVVDEQVDLLQSVGLKPTIVDVDRFALGNAFVLQRGGGDGKVLALVDIGASKTNINILQGETSYFTREVYVAGSDFNARIAREMEVDVSEVEALKRDPGDRAELVQEAVSAILDDLCNEINLSFDFYQNEFDREVEEVYLSGGSSQLVGLVDSLGRMFGRPTQRWDPTEALEMRVPPEAAEQLRANASQFAVAIGLASRASRM